jgi:hypothetical protein
MIHTLDYSATLAVAEQAAATLLADQYTTGCPRCAYSRSGDIVYADAHRSEADWSHVPAATARDWRIASQHAWEVPVSPECRRCTRII